MIAIEYIIGSLEVGGAERHLSQILPALKRCGVFVSVLVLSDKAPLKPLFDQAGIKVSLGLNLDWLPSFVRRPIRLVFSSIRLILSFLRNRGAIRHVFLPEAYILAAIAARITFFKGVLVLSRRSLNDYQKRRPILGILERFLHRFTTVALGNSRAVVHQLHEEGFEHGKVGLIYNGIDLTPFQFFPSKQELREQLDLNQEAVIFIIVANLIYYKGHMDLLDALASVSNSLPEKWTLLCVGKDSGILKKLINHAENLGIIDHIKFLGKRADIAKLLGASDIGILCSHEEGFSNSILEGMAAGLPMVVTNVGGNAEAVTDMQTGLVVESKNPVALGEALLSMALAPNLRESFGKQGQKRVYEYFTVTQCAQQYAEFYVALAKDQLE